MHDESVNQLCSHTDLIATLKLLTNKGELGSNWIVMKDGKSFPGPGFNPPGFDQGA